MSEENAQQQHDDDSNGGDLASQSDSKRQKPNDEAEPQMTMKSASISVDVSEADRRLILEEDDEGGGGGDAPPTTSAAAAAATTSKSTKRKRDASKSATSDDTNAATSPVTKRDKDHEDESKSSSSSSKKLPKEKLAPPLNADSPSYWAALQKTALCREHSVGLRDLLSREFGYSRNNMGAGLFTPRNTFTTHTPLTTPHEFAKRVTSNLSFVRRMKISQELSFHTGCVNALCFNRMGTMLASGSDDFQVCLWDWARATPALTFDSGHKSNVFQTKFMPFTGDTQVVTCARDGQVRLALISTSGSHLGTKKLAKHADSCHKLAIETDSPNIFLSAGEDAVVYEIDLRQETPAKILTVRSPAGRHSSSRVPLYSVSSNPAQSYEFCVAGKDQFVRVYDKRMLVEGRGVLKMLAPSALRSASHDAAITSAVYSFDGSEIVASYSEHDIFLFDNKQEGEVVDAKYSYKGHRNSETIKGVNFYGAESEYIVSGSDCGRVFWWEKSTQQIVQTDKGDEHGVVNVLEPHPTFPIVATSGLDNEVKIWTPVSETVNEMKNLADIVQENQRTRDNSRHFSLSSFEFELLLLLMNRPNNRIFFRTRDGDISISSQRENATTAATTTTSTTTTTEAAASSDDPPRRPRIIAFRRRQFLDDDDDNEREIEDDDDDDSEDEEDDDDDDSDDFGVVDDDDGDDEDMDDGEDDDDEYESHVVTRHLTLLRRRLGDEDDDEQSRENEAPSTSQQNAQDEDEAGSN